MWSGEQTNHVRLAEPSDVIDKMVYAMANPVAAFLVRHGKSWPGTRWLGRVRRGGSNARADSFRRRQDGGQWPDEVVLEHDRPPGHAPLSDDALGAQIKNAIEVREREIRKFADDNKIKFAGARAVRKTSRYDFARSDEQRFGIVPTFIVPMRSIWSRDFGSPRMIVG